ncbi:MAG: hypothetical protein RIT24_134, partial [Planctomycetota bacterium]
RSTFATRAQMVRQAIAVVRRKASVGRGAVKVVAVAKVAGRVEEVKAVVAEEVAPQVKSAVCSSA